jgi:uroporphyrinogen-III decarboxylase
MEAITRSTINHIQHAKKIGASGTLVSVFNAESKFGSVTDYATYTRPYDKRVIDALADTKLTVLHLHFLERPYIDQFTDFPAPIIQHSVKTSGISVSEIRAKFSQTILGGVDEIDFQNLTADQMRHQWTEARQQAGAKYIAAPGCSVPDASTPAELARLPQSLGLAV